MEYGIKDQHKIVWPKGIRGLFKRACWEIPEIMGASFMGLLGLALAGYAVYKYKKIDGDNREYHFVYYVLRHSDPKACELKNAVKTEYPANPCPGKKKQEANKEAHAEAKKET